MRILRLTSSKNEEFVAEKSKKKKILGLRWEKMGNVELGGTKSWKCGFRREIWEKLGSEKQKMGDLGFRRTKNGEFEVQERKKGEVWDSEEQKMGNLGCRRAKNGPFFVHKG